MLKNANIASSGVLPMCQDTGTAIIIGYKGEKVFTNSNDEESLSLGVYKTYQENRNFYTGTYFGVGVNKNTLELKKSSRQSVS